MSRICSIIMRESHFQRVQFKFSFFSKKIDDFIIIDPVTSIPDPLFLSNVLRLNLIPHNINGQHHTI